MQLRREARLWQERNAKPAVAQSAAQMRARDEVMTEFGATSCSSSAHKSSHHGWLKHKGGQKYSPRCRHGLNQKYFRPKQWGKYAPAATKTRDSEMRMSHAPPWNKRSLLKQHRPVRVQPKPSTLNQIQTTGSSRLKCGSLAEQINRGTQGEDTAIDFRGLAHAICRACVYSLLLLGTTRQRK